MEPALSPYCMLEDELISHQNPRAMYDALVSSFLVGGEQEWGREKEGAKDRKGGS